VSVLRHKIRHDLWRHRRRTLTAIVSIAAGLFGVGGIFGMVDRLLVAMDAAHVAVSPSHVNLILRDFVPGAALRAADGGPGVATVEPAAQLYVRYRLGEGEEWRNGILVTRATSPTSAWTPGARRGRLPRRRRVGRRAPDPPLPRRRPATTSRSTRWAGP
jgi:hypothetical protein